MAISITPSPFGSVTVTLDGELGGVLSVGVLATSNSALNMDLGVPGPQGEAGEPGANGQNGVGVPVGGTAGQVLAKIDGTNYNTEWIDVAAGDYLPLAGGNMTGDIIWSAVGTGNDSAIGTFGFGTENVTLGQTAYIEPNNIVSTLYVPPNLPDAPTGYTKTVTINADGIVGNQNNPNLGDYGFTLNNGGVNGVVNSENVWSINTTGVYGGLTGAGSDTYFTLNSNGFTSGNQVDDGVAFTKALGLRFSDGTYQTTAFPPAGGTTAQYIDGTGALQTFPTITTAGKMVTTVRNNSGATITKGTVVYINGAVGNKPTIAKAQANSEATSKATFAFVEADIANNADGNVVQIGLLENIDTQGFSDGTQIFLSPTTAGGWTSTQPFSPYHYVRLGTVIRGGHPTQGSISVNIINGFQLDEMSDVGAISPTNNNVLTWVSASSQWLDRSITTILGYTPANVANYAYATTAQAQAGTSTTTVVSPATLLDAKYFQGGKYLGGIVWTTATSGTGASSGSGGNARNLLAPTSAVGYAQAYQFVYNNARGQSPSSGVDWSKRVTIGGRFGRTVTTPDANSVMRFTFGRAIPVTTAGDLSTRGIGIRQSGTNAVELQVHNGTTLYNVTSSFTPTVNQAFDVVIISEGGTATLYINGTSVATSANAPTTLAGTNLGAFILEVANTSTLSGNAINYTCTDTFAQVNI